ncbi:MAG: hypothetical protein ACYC4L_16775 [Chloroflexota bacterium]
MRTEPATILGIFLGGVFFFFLLMPLGVVLGRLPAVWRESKRTWLLLAGLIALTGFFFILLIVGFYLVAQA